MTEKTTRSCVCEKCVRACEITPGWFMPGEAEKAAQLLGMSFDDFKDKYLILDHCDNWRVNDAPYLWSPRKESDPPKEKVRSWESQRARAKCVFLENQRCRIHEAKPFECKQALCCENQFVNVRDDIERAYMNADYPLGQRL